ncbi:hypothetical protein [Reichenbachiella sp.]|uniref:hypothetical protein n=1 Tax=Reichenbachiella sp. TaxID=2184521 RepID=UPI003B5BA818
MIKRWSIFFLMLLGAELLQAQTMEEKVVAYLEIFLTENKSFISEEELPGTIWSTSDIMGKSRILFLQNFKFKRENTGFQANSSKVRGNWYINNEFVVLEKKKEKTPLYVLKNNEEIILVDDDQIDVLKQLLTDASYKDGALKPYSYSEIFTFLNGFTLQIE